VKAFLIIAAAALLALGATPAPSPRPSPDPAAIAAVSAYVAALQRGDFDAAFALLTAEQQRYFGNAHNLASNSRASGFVIHSYKVIGQLSHGAIVEAMVEQQSSFMDIASGKTITGVVREPYFALRENGAWRVKELYQPWKSYAPNMSGSAHGVEVIVARIEFYDKRIRFDCAIRNTGSVGVQVLPLAKTTLDDGSGAKIPAMNEATFPLNDVGFFEGMHLQPGQQAIGFINFPVAQKKDADQTLTLTVAPAIADGAEQTFSIVVGPIHLAKL
jgi:limonene-1,2-epoxide hydrolase